MLIFSKTHCIPSGRNVNVFVALHATMARNYSVMKGLHFLDKLNAVKVLTCT